MNWKRTLAITLMLLTIQVVAQDEQVYHVTLLRAKPGGLLELIDALKTRAKDNTVDSRDNTLVMRHSQGDHWDLMIVYPLRGYYEYFSGLERKTRGVPIMVNEVYGHELNDLLSFREEGFFIGPDLEDFSQLFETYKLFHIEIFTALAGKQKELIKE